MLEGLSHILQKISDGVVTIASWLLAFFMGGMVISILLAIISRFIIKIPLPWTEELSRYLMIWTAFVAGSLGLKSGVHVGVKVLVQMAPEMIARWIGFITNLVLLFFFLILVIEGFHMTGLVVSQSSPVLGISMAWIYSSLPVGGIIFSLFVLQSLVENVRGFLKKTA